MVKIVLAGTPGELKPIMTLLLGIQQLIAEKDIGEFVGYPVDDWARVRSFGTKMFVYFCSEPNSSKTKTPGKRFVRATYGIPAVDKAKLDWNKIKEACGGQNGFLWGRFCCCLGLEGGRQMQVYGGSDTEAEQRAKALAAFSSLKIVSVTVREEKKEGRRKTDKKAYKETTRVYPIYFTILNQQKIISESQGTATLSGNLSRKSSGRINLWVPNKPKDFESKIKEAFLVRGMAIK